MGKVRTFVIFQDRRMVSHTIQKVSASFPLVWLNMRESLGSLRKFPDSLVLRQSLQWTAAPYKGASLFRRHLALPPPLLFSFRGLVLHKLAPGVLT